MTTPFQLQLRQQLKAVGAFLFAAIPLLIAGILSDGLSRDETAVAVLTGVLAYVGIFYTPNQDKKGVDRTDLSTQAGYVTLGLVALIFAIVLLCILVVLPLLNGASL